MKRFIRWLSWLGVSYLLGAALASPVDSSDRRQPLIASRGADPK